MKRRLISALLAIAMTASLLATGCASTPAKEDSKEETTDESSDEATTTTDAAATDGDDSEITFNAVMPVGGLMQATEFTTEDLDAAGTEEMDRAMRAYIPPTDSLIINNANSFYYYDHISEDSQVCYDAILMVAESAAAGDGIVTLNTDQDPHSQEFAETLYTGFYALLYDHPELFWMYNEILTKAEFYVGIPQQVGMNTVYISLSNPVPDYEKIMNTFYDAVDAFLEEIDLTRSDAEIAADIHDKLTALVTYDHAVCDTQDRANLAHTAYGALVANNDGTPNYAVCDGYSLAYLYLLQQVGIEATVILGTAGSDAESAGGHAWSIINVDGEWKEVDSTWDDVGTREEQITPDINGYEYYVECLTDPAYRDHLEHYLYRTSTETITNYVPGDEDVYITKDGKYRISLTSKSVHLRDTRSAYGILMGTAPIAN